MADLAADSDGQLRTSMINRLRTLSARLVTRHHIGPRALQIRAWAWLAAEADDLAEKVHCLDEILGLGSTLDWAQAALTRVWYRWRREN
jgi:hypothetical protein